MCVAESEVEGIEQAGQHLGGLCFPFLCLCLWCVVCPCRAGLCYPLSH